MIELVHIEKRFQDSCPIKDISVTINNGDVISVIGPSGTGKSTLLRCINILDPPTGGKIIFNGKEINQNSKDIYEFRKKVGMVFQSFNLFNHLSVIENVIMPQVDLLGRSNQEAYDKGIELLRQVGLAEKAMKRTNELSGGQKQRVAIARTLAMDPEIILFDEPTSALDPTMIGEVEEVINSLAEKGHTMMIVTHEMEFAKRVANRVFYLDGGTVYDEGTPEEIFINPVKDRTRRFVKKLKTLEINIESRDFDFMEEISRINEYGYKNMIDPRRVYKIQSAFDELTRHLILPKLNSGEDKMYAAIEYSSADNSVVLDLRYGGKPFDPLSSKDDLSLKVLSSAAAETKYEYMDPDENGFTNRVHVTI